MYNTDKPQLDDLPTARQLLCSTLIALAAAIAILLSVVLPAEYAIDPTGLGQVLGLTKMGEIKAQLAAEAAADAKRDAERAANRSALPSVNVERTAKVSSEVTRVPLAGGQSTEVKLLMKAGDKAEFSWQVQGGLVNFDLHAHGDNGQTISYQKGRAASSHSGVIEAAFDGEHGWFWRNLSENAIEITLQTSGQYTDILFMEL